MLNQSTELRKQPEMREYNSAENDQGLAQIHYVLHGNSSAQDSANILQTGLTVKEGRPTVSTDLAHAVRWATTSEKRDFSQSPTERSANEIGRIFVFSKPQNLSLGYGMFTSMRVDNEQRAVSGAPVKYASGRKQLALYHAEDTEVLRREAEAQHQLGLPPVELALSNTNIAVSIKPSENLQQFIDNFEASCKQFVIPDINAVAGELAEIISQNPENYVSPTVDIDELAQEIIRSTAESIIISRIRNLDLDVKRATGYRIQLENGDIDSKAVEPDAVRDRVEKLFNLSHDDNFSLQREWLTNLVKQAAENMRKQLDDFTTQPS